MNANAGRSTLQRPRQPPRDHPWSVVNMIKLASLMLMIAPLTRPPRRVCARGGARRLARAIVKSPRHRLADARKRRVARAAICTYGAWRAWWCTASRPTLIPADRCVSAVLSVRVLARATEAGPRGAGRGRCTYLAAEAARATWTAGAGSQRPIEVEGTKTNVERVRPAPCTTSTSTAGTRAILIIRATPQESG